VPDRRYTTEEDAETHDEPGQVAENQPAADESRIASRQGRVRAYVPPGAPPPNYAIETRDENEQQPRVPKEDLFNKILESHFRCAQRAVSPAGREATRRVHAGVRRLHRISTSPLLVDLDFDTAYESSH